MSSSLNANRSKPNFDRESLCLRSQISATKSLSCALPSKSASWGLFLDAVNDCFQRTSRALGFLHIPGTGEWLSRFVTADSCSLRPLIHFIVTIWPCKNGRNCIFYKISPCTCQTLSVVRLHKVPRTTIEGCVRREFFCHHVSSLCLMFSL